MKLTVALLASVALTASAFNTAPVAFNTAASTVGRTSVALEASKNKQKIASRTKWAESRGFGAEEAAEEVAAAAGRKKSISDLSEDELKGKKVLVRCDVNVPLDGKTITDDTRIRSSIPTIEYLKSKGAIVTVCSHLGRPKDGPEDKFSLGPCAARMGELLGQEVKLAPDCIGDDVAAIVAAAAE
eukprot:12329188-Ditylum_brightwellii.AAC.1